jgi:hypothetical protein
MLFVGLPCRANQGNTKYTGVVLRLLDKFFFLFLRFEQGFSLQRLHQRKDREHSV